MEISAAITAFLNYVRVEKGLSPNTISAYSRDMYKFDAFAKKSKLTLQQVSRDDLVDFLSSLYRQKVGKPDGGAASGDAAEFLPVRANPRDDHRRSID